MKLIGNGHIKFFKSLDAALIHYLSRGWTTKEMASKYGRTFIATPPAA